MTTVELGLRRGGALSISSVAAIACIVGHTPRFVDASDRTLSAYCDRGYGRACLFLAERLLEWRPESDGVLMTSAAERGCELDRACEVGVPIACERAATFYQDGRGVALDEQRARERCTRTQTIRHEDDEWWGASPDQCPRAH